MSDKKISQLPAAPTVELVDVFPLVQNGVTYRANISQIPIEADETEIVLVNVTTNNATTLRHGFLPILPGNPSVYLDGNGNYTTPSGTSNSYKIQSFTGVSSINVIHNFGTFPIVQVIKDSSGLVLTTITATSITSIIHNTVNDFTVTLSGNETGKVIASVGSPQPQAVTIVNNDYTVLDTDRIVKITSANKTMTLPTAVGNTGREFIINNASAGTCYVDGDGTETISGELLQSLPTGSSMSVYSDGTNYQII